MSMLISHAFIVHIPQDILENLEQLHIETDHFDYRNVTGQRADLLGYTVSDYLIRYLAHEFTHLLGKRYGCPVDNVGLDAATQFLSPFFGEYMPQLYCHRYPQFYGDYITLEFIDCLSVLVREHYYYVPTILPTNSDLFESQWQARYFQ